MSHIIQNAVKITEEGKVTYLPSIHRHHYNQYKFKNGNTFAVDGGTDYFRRGFGKDFGKYSIVEDYCLTDESTRYDIFDRLLWGSRGKSGKDAVKYLPFRELELSHLKAILAYNDKLAKKLSDMQIGVIRYWIEQKSVTQSV